MTHDIYQPPKVKVEGKENDLVLDTNYPFWRVVLIFAVFGGAVGGVILSLLIFISHILEDSTFDSGFAFGFMFFAFYGAILGFIPAALTGWYLAYKRFMLRHRWDYGKFFLIGTLATVIYVLGIVLIFLMLRF